MYTILDVNTWNRKEHFEFYNSFDNPFYGFTTQVECKRAYEFCKLEKKSFFLFYLHCILKSINDIENFKMRIVNREVRVYDKIHVSSTIGREDYTFGFSSIDYKSEFIEFYDEALIEVNRVKSMQGLCMDEKSKRVEVIHFSAIPWFSFTSLEHARHLGMVDSCPKVSVGKMYQQGDSMFMPVSMHCHHALVDGYHVGLFYELLNKYLNRK